jgi:hypothetical protein
MPVTARRAVLESFGVEVMLLPRVTHKGKSVSAVNVVHKALKPSKKAKQLKSS